MGQSNHIAPEATQITEEPLILDSPEQVLTTLRQDGKRNWLYPTPSKGRHTRRRLVVGWILVALFVALPIVRIAGRPAVLLDIVGREFSLFGLVFYATDTLLLLLLMVAAMVGIILFTALLGRVWCGWACPQTIYLEFVFRPIEQLIEGKEHVRKRRDEGPTDWDKLWRKSLKWSIYLVIALLLSHAFVAYFVGWERLLVWLTDDPAEHWDFFVMMALTTGLILFDFGVFREQMCTITCPYARFQSVLLDPNSLIVSYDPSRGEPRARRGKKLLRAEERGEIAAQGDCIDCYACVRTCPTGIDIRDGLQMECVACTQCIDACDQIMDNIGKPKGLIRYTSERTLEGRSSRLVRPRSVLYSALFIVLIAAFTVALTNRGQVDVNVGRAVGEPFRELPDERVANRLRFRVRNLQKQATSFTITGLEPGNVDVNVVGASPVTLEPGEMKRVEAWVVVTPESFRDGRAKGVFEILFEDESRVIRDFELLGPTRE